VRGSCGECLAWSDSLSGLAFIFPFHHHGCSVVQSHLSDYQLAITNIYGPSNTNSLINFYAILGMWLPPSLSLGFWWETSTSPAFCQTKIMLTLVGLSQCASTMWSTPWSSSSCRFWTACSLGLTNRALLRWLGSTGLSSTPPLPPLSLELYSPLATGQPLTTPR